MLVGPTRPCFPLMRSGEAKTGFCLKNRSKRTSPFSILPSGPPWNKVAYLVTPKNKKANSESTRSTRT